MRSEIALLRDESRELAQLRKENQRLAAALPPAAELESLRADRAAIGRLRGEIDALNDSLQKREHALNAAPKLIDPTNPEAASSPLPALTMIFGVDRDGRLSFEGKPPNLEALKQRLGQMARGERVSFKIQQPKTEAGQSDAMMLDAEVVFDLLKETTRMRGLKMTMELLPPSGK